MKIKVKNNGNTIKVSHKKIAKAYRKQNTFLSFDMSRWNRMEKIIVDNYGTPVEKLSIEDMRPIFQIVAKLGETFRNKERLSLIARKCAVYNEMGKQMHKITKQIARDLTPFLNKKVYLASGGQSAIFEKFQLPELTFKQPKDIPDLGMERSSLYISKSYEYIDVKLSIRYKSMPDEAGNTTSLYYERTCSIAKLDSETKQILTVIEEPKAKVEKINPKDQLHWLNEVARIKQELSEAQGNIIIDRL